MKELVQKDITCEEKLKQIHQLLGLPYHGESESLPTPGSVKSGNDEEETEGVRSEGVGRNEEEENGENSVEEIESGGREESLKKIVEGLNEKEKKIAIKIINRIEMSPDISYDYESLEVIIHGKKILHSSLKELIGNIVRLEVPNLPLSFVTFVSALVDIKLPVFFFKNGDALMVRQNLLAIRKQKNNKTVENDEEEKLNGVESNGDDVGGDDNIGIDDNVDIVGNKNLAEEEERGKRKRKLDLTGDEESSTPSEEPRRSKRLKLRPELNKNWNSLHGFE